jgi:predicted MPP superfamily phosphohydrolase
MRVLHLSDVHVTVPVWEMPWREMLNKRLIGAANLVLRRGHHFARAREKLAAMARFSEEHGVDLVVVTGDYTALGTDPELAAARSAIDGLTRRPYGFVTVPGNHDIYLQDVVREGRFERHFGDLLRSDLPERCVDGPWPLVKLFDDVAVIAVNSARPNPAFWRSNGAIPAAQVSALAELCQDERIRNRFVFVITHYAPRRSDASPDRKLHGLDNADAFLQACSGLPRCAILHGHIHWRFEVALEGFAPRLFGAGSATCAGREGFWLFDVDGARSKAIPGSFSGDRYILDDSAAVSF